NRARDPIGPAEVERLVAAAAAGAERRAAELARAHGRRTMLAYGGILIGAVIAAATLGVFWGKASANVAVHETERGLAAAFQSGPAAASAWLSLMQSNGPEMAVGTCKGAALRAIGGRRACDVPLWLDPPKPSAPTQR